MSCYKVQPYKGASTSKSTNWYGHQYESNESQACVGETGDYW